MNIQHIFRILRRGFGLKCPRCGQGQVFDKGFKTHVHCSNCDLKFEREQGYFVGAMYINYGVTVLIAFTAYFAFDYFTPIGFITNLILWGSFSALFPVFFFRYSRSLWLSFDYIFNPE